MGTSAYLLRKSAPAAVEPLDLMRPRGGDLVELAVPMSPVLDGAGNGTSAYLLCKYAPASGACPGPRSRRRRPDRAECPSISLG